ncbi:MAG: hypothetical protein K6U10_03685 [Acidobacteriia bacterium]|nr:hypothetical protein [Methyloceanibacter sp.]MCL6490907.1 hypothetical protein [Terriglobia bacterium]
MRPSYDRTQEDLGNIVELGHVNVQVPDQHSATLFYITGLGLTRDPYLMTGVTNMWVNVGRSQFHLPRGPAQVVAGRIGLVLPDLEAALHRLAAIRDNLADSRFGFREGDGFIDVTCPWGNQIRLHAPDMRFGRIVLGMPYVEINVPRGVDDGIIAFYREILNGPAEHFEDREGPGVRVLLAPDQYLIFRETDRPIPPYDGAHIQITLVNFSEPHRRLLERGLITEESDQHQYRFENVIDPRSGQVLVRFQHEVRSMCHPLFGRPLVNRNPAQTNTQFVPGYENLPWAMP